MEVGKFPNSCSEAINYSVDDYPVAVIDRIEIIRGPGASIWGTNAVNGVINLVTKHSSDTQGDSVRLLIQDNGTFMGDYVHGGQISDHSYYRVWVRNQEYRKVLSIQAYLPVMMVTSAKQAFAMILESGLT